MSMINNQRDEVDSRIQSEVVDKVRVDEVQDALRRLTESFQAKIENVHSETMRITAQKSEDCYAGLESLKRELDHVNEIHT